MRTRTGMRAFLRARALGALFLTTATATGCGLIYGIGDYEISETPVNVPETGTDGSEQPDTAPPPECYTNLECVDRITKLGPLDAGPDVDAADAAPLGVLADGGEAPAMCIKGKCQRLLTEDCTTVVGDYKNNDAVLVATLFSTVGANGTTNIARQKSALLAAEEVNTSLGGDGLPPVKGGTRNRPLVAIGCDEAANWDRVTKHLTTNLQIAGIVGPNLSQHALDFVKLTVPTDTLYITSAALASPIADLVDNDLVWRNIPSDQQRAALLVNQINEVEANLHATRGATLKIGIAYRNDAVGLSAFNSISSMSFNGRALSAAENANFVRQVGYSTTDAAARTAIATDWAANFKPDIIALFGPTENITNILLPYERALETAGESLRPQYVLIDANKSKELLDGTAAGATGMPSSSGPNALRPRVRGTGHTPEPDSVAVFNSFNGTYSTRYGDNPRVSAMGPSYDAMYAIAFALAATTDEPVSGTSIAHGLKKLGVGQNPKELPVGIASIREGYQLLTSGQPFRPIGTFNRMGWNAKGDISGGKVEVWCIGTPGGGAPVYLPSGLTMDVTSQQISGTFTACPSN